MSDDQSRRDENKVAGLLAYDHTDDHTLRRVKTDSIGRLLVSTSGSGPVTRTDAFQYGTLTLAPSASGSVVTFVTTATGVLIGFLATASGDGRYELTVSGSPVLSGRVNVANPMVSVVAPEGGLTIASGVTITLTATADTNPSSATFEGTVILG